MPLVIRPDELQPGMRLHEPLVVNGRVMLQSGRELTEAEIAALRRRYPTVGLRIADPVLDSVIEFEDDARERQVAQVAQQRVSECMSEVHERFSNRAALTRVDFNIVQSTVRELMEYLRSNPASAALVASCMDASSYLGTHAGNVFYLSMLLGSAALDYVASERRRQLRAKPTRPAFATDLTSLGLGAMVMDLGMLPIQHVVRTNRPLSASEREAIRQHPNTGYEMLPETFSPVARVVVKTHHENMAGTGYPQRLPGERLHVFARIVRIADAFDAATSVRVHRGAKSPARVLWEMALGPYQRYYDPKLMAVFATLIQPFPIGSKLRLTDGRYAAVVKYNRRDPFDPLVIIAFDARNRLLPRLQLEGPLRLSTRPDLRIASLHGEDLSFLYRRRSTWQSTPSHTFGNPLEAAYP